MISQKLSPIFGDNFCFIYICSMIRNEIYGQSNSDVVRLLGRRFRQYRIAMQLKQTEVAKRAGVSVFTLSQFENGRSCNITMTNLVALLRTIGMLENVETLLPELPVSPYELERQQKNEKQRVRNEK